MILLINFNFAMDIVYYAIEKVRGMLDYAVNNVVYYRNADTPMKRNISENYRTIINIKLTRDKIKDKIHNYEYIENKYRFLAQKVLKENNKAAVKQSKLKKIEVDHLINMLFMLIEQINMMEKARIEAGALKILDVGIKINKEIQIRIEKFQQ